MKKSTIILFIWAILFILMVILAYYFNWYTNICIWFNWKCDNIAIPNLWVLSISLMSALFPIFMFFWRHYSNKEDEEKKTNHLKFLRTINEKEDKFEVIYFDDYDEAEKKYNVYKNGYILPIWYLYDIWMIDYAWRLDFIDKINEYTLNEFTIEQIDSIESGDENKLEYIKQFIDLEDYRERLKIKWLKVFNLKDKNIKDIFNENFIELNKWTLKRKMLCELLKDTNIYSFVLIKWYYLLYKKN